MAIYCPEYDPDMGWFITIHGSSGSRIEYIQSPLHYFNKMGVTPSDSYQLVDEDYEEEYEDDFNNMNYESTNYDSYFSANLFNWISTYLPDLFSLVSNVMSAKPSPLPAVTNDPQPSTSYLPAHPTVNESPLPDSTKSKSYYPTIPSPSPYPSTSNHISYDSSEMDTDSCTSSLDNLYDEEFQGSHTNKIK